MVDIMNILILGDTAWLSSAIACIATGRGHNVICAARGTDTPPKGCFFVPLDRNQPDTYAALPNVTWDAVVDVTTSYRFAADATTNIRTNQWVYVSSASVYADISDPHRDETTPLVSPEGADTPGNFPAAKVACEQQFPPETTCIIRPGLIGGAGDPTGRSGYYPWRFAHPTGPEVLVPNLHMPVSMINVADLAAWIVHCMEHQVVGVFNASGPAHTLKDVCRLSPIPVREVPTEVLLAAGINQWLGPTSLPLWLADSNLQYAMVFDSTAARNHGLTTRPLPATLHAAARTFQPGTSGLTDEEERKLRAYLTASKSE
mgnify:FL=1